jgi:plasmid replication initiation protein
MEFANQEKIHQIVVSTATRNIMKRNATITMFIGTTATDKETIKLKNAEIRNGRMNTDATQTIFIGFKGNI